ncbi:MAG: hypothetical protein WBM52_04720, partial [Thiogranum sp.]
GTGTAQVAVDGVDTLDRPAQGHGPLSQCVLPLGALGILHHLAQRRLANVEIRIAGKMRRCDLLVLYVPLETRGYLPLFRSRTKITPP